MRAAVCLASLVLAGCSSLLGIQDPGTGTGGDGSVDGTDAPPSGDLLHLSLGDLRLSQGQVVQVRVQLTHKNGTTEDVTSTATLGSSNPAVATTATGAITGATTAGTATITARLGDAAAASLNVTVTTATCHLVINEFATGSATSSADEWVELYNPCATMIDVTNWTLDYRAASNLDPVGADNDMMIALSGPIQPGQFRLFAGAGYQGNAVAKWTQAGGIMKQDTGTIGVRSGPVSTGAVVDAVAYGPFASLANVVFHEGQAAGALANGLSAARQLFDGNDSDDNATDFKISATATPGTSNAP